MKLNNIATPNNFLTTGVPSYALLKQAGVIDKSAAQKFDKKNDADLDLANASVTVLKGVGPATAKEFAKVGINTVFDLATKNVDTNALGSSKKAYEVFADVVKKNIAFG